MVALTPIVPGQVVEIADGVRRITAPNPGMMTGPGTNTYIIGHDELIMVDPGPDLDAHRDVLLNAVGDRLRSIVCTHTHRDHSPLAVQIRAKTGAPVLGFGVVPSDGRQDEDFVPERALADGDMVECGNHRLRAVHTPGHASNHLCYLLEDRGILFTGDHVMQGSTVVISPPDGNMQAYFDSLDKVLGLPIQMFAPGHGFVIEHHRVARGGLAAHIGCGTGDEQGVNARFLQLFVQIARALNERAVAGFGHLPVAGLGLQVGVQSVSIVASGHGFTAQLQAGRRR